MPRQPRVVIPGGFHHVGVKAIRSEPLFRGDDDREHLFALFTRSCERYHLDVHMYVLMTTHTHFVIEDHDGNLSQAMRYVNSNYARGHNARYGFDGSLVKARFWSSLIDTNQYLTASIRYGHLNPLAAGMVERLSDYPHSSYPAHLGLVPPPAFLSTRLVKKLFGPTLEEIRRSTETVPIDPAVQSHLESSIPAPVLGTSGFVDELTLDNEVNRRLARPRWPLPVIRQLVENTLGDPVSHWRGRRAHVEDPRRLFAATVFFGTSWTQTEAAAAIGVSTSTMSRLFTEVARSGMEQHEWVQAILHRVECGPWPERP